MIIVVAVTAWLLLNAALLAFLHVATDHHLGPLSVLNTFDPVAEAETILREDP